jgi:hypothetical protein
MVRTCVSSRPPPGLDQGLGILCPGISGHCREWPGPCTRGSGTRPRGSRTRPRGSSTPVEVLDLTRRSSPYVQGSGTFPWGSGSTVDILEYIVFSGHVATREPSTWWGRVLFTTRLEIAAWAPCLHIVVRGTPILGYRQWPPGPSQGRIRACRWGQSLVGDWCAASVRLLT